MRLLLGTHLMLWWAGKHPSLPKGLRELVDAAESVYFSRASILAVAAGRVFKLAHARHDTA